MHSRFCHSLACKTIELVIYVTVIVQVNAKINTCLITLNITIPISSFAQKPTASNMVYCRFYIYCDFASHGCEGTESVLTARFLVGRFLISSLVHIYHKGKVVGEIAGKISQITCCKQTCC